MARTGRPGSPRIFRVSSRDLVLLHREPVLTEDVHAGDHVERDRSAEDLAHRQAGQVRTAERLLLPAQLLDLLGQLAHALRPRPADRLIGGDHELAHAERAVQRGQRHQRGDRGAVRVRHQPGISGEGVGVDLGDDQGHAVGHPERGGVVDADRAGLDGRGDQLAGRPAPRRPQRQVHPFQRAGYVGGHDQVRVAERNPASLRALGGERDDLVGREGSLRQDPEHLPADRSGGSDDGDAHGIDPRRGVSRGRLPRPARTRRGGPAPRARRRWRGSRRTRGSTTSRSSRC